MVCFNVLGNLYNWSQVFWKYNLQFWFNFFAK